MQNSLLTQYLTFIDTKIDTFLASQNWKMKVVLLSCVVMLVSFFNNLSPLKSFGEMYDALRVHHVEFFLYETVADRAQDLTGNFDYEPYSGKESRTFRLVAPIFVKMLGITHVTAVLYLLQLAFGVLFFYLLTTFLYHLLNSKSATFWAMMGIASIYLGAAFFIDNGGYGDLFSYLFLFLIIYFRRSPVLVFVFAQLACWNDERAMVGSGLAMIWLWWYPYQERNEKPKVSVNWSMFALAFSWMIWYAGRSYLMNVVGMKPTYNPDGEFMLRIQQSIDSLGLRMLWQFEGWWLVLLLATLFLLSTKNYLSLLAIGGATLLSSLSAMIIYDSTRSGTFGFISIFFGLVICQKYLTEKQFRWMLLLVALICFLHPLASRTHGVGFFLM